MTDTTSGFLFGNSTPGQFTGQITDTSTMPAWYQQALGQQISAASNILGQPYQTYQGQRLADLTPDQLQAQSMTQNAVSTANPYSTQAANLENSGSTFNQSNFNNYLNPYSQDLNNSIEQQGMQNFNEQVAPTLQNSFVGSGMFGDSTHADLYQKALRDQQTSILNAQASNMSSDYNNAMSGYMQGQGNQLTAGNNLNNMGQNVYGNSLTGASALAGIGAQNQQQNQNSLDLAYQDYQNQLNYPTNQLNEMNAIIRGYQPTATTTQTANPATTITSNPLSGALTGLVQMGAAANQQTKAV